MTTSDQQGFYTAFKSKDIRFDGRFFVGVSSTGIYCRPVCRARMPKIENCTFFSSAAEAEQAGYRPCLLCRPELAPGRSITDAKTSLAHRAARVLEENCGHGLNLDALADRLGCTSRHLRRTFSEEFHVSPLQYRQTCRLLLAKNLLTDTDISIIDIAMASGFGSLRRFNDVFKNRYHMPPTALRKQAKKENESTKDITITLGYRLPYQWETLLAFLELRAIPGVEAVKNGAYFRTVQLENIERKKLTGWICVKNNPEKNALSVMVAASLLPVLSQVLAKVRHLFDLHCDPEAVSETLELMNRIQKGLFVPGIRVPGCFDSFEMCVRAVLGQQITVKAASTLAARIAESYGSSLSSGIDGLASLFPTPEDIIALKGAISDHLGPLGVTSARANTILALAHAFVDESIDFGLSAQPDLEIEKLQKLPGIGVWTAQYIAMRSMGWPDAFLETDYGVKKAFAPMKPKEIRTLAESWRPWRSYAMLNIWNSLSHT